MSVILTPGQAGDNPHSCCPCWTGSRSSGTGPASPDPTGSLPTRPTRARPPAALCVSVASRSPVRRRRTTLPTGSAKAVKAGARPCSLPWTTRDVTLWSGASTGPSSSALWPHALPNAPPTTAPSSRSPRSSSGSANHRTRPSRTTLARPHRGPRPSPQSRRHH